MSDDFYRKFENRHRGSVEDIKSRVAVYLPFIEILAQTYPETQVADLGCGRGEWLELLKDKAIPAVGVDLDEGMLERGQSIGLEVKKMDFLAFLQQLKDESLIAVTGFHIAEHLPFDVLRLLFEEALRVLKPGGLLILETPNPENTQVASHYFYLDPTHERPLPPSLLEFLAQYYGFGRSKILRLQEDPILKNPETQIQLTHVFSGVSPDYSLLTQKKGDEHIISLMNIFFENEYGLTFAQLSHRYEQRITYLEQEIQALHQTLIWRFNIKVAWILHQIRLILKDGLINRSQKALKRILKS